MATTGYVSLIDNGEITTPKDFLKVCLRAFGIMNRKVGDSLSLESVENVDFTLTNDSTYNYYKKSLERDIESLKEIEEKSNNSEEIQNEAYKEFIKYYENEINSCLESIAKINERNAKLNYFIDVITQWDCSEQYNSVKEFALKQLVICKDDCEYYNEAITRYKKLLETPVESFKEYLNNQIESIKNSIQSHEESLFKCIENNKEARDFYNGFMAELEKME